MYLPIELINNIFNFNGKEIYYDKLTNENIVRFTKKYLNSHSYNKLKHDIVFEDDLTVIKLYTGIERRGLRYRYAVTEKVIVIEKNINYNCEVLSAWIYSHNTNTDAFDYIESSINNFTLGRNFTQFIPTWNNHHMTRTPNRSWN
jgi:hypothetical protein